MVCGVKSGYKLSQLSAKQTGSLAGRVVEHGGPPVDPICMPKRTSFLGAHLSHLHSIFTLNFRKEKS
jgi:hypothetical protein